MKTYSLKQSAIQKKWYLLDATNLVLGRLASEVSMILRGKHKPIYSSHLDCGDNVIIINADKVFLTGRKGDRKDGKIYYRHTGFPGGIKETTAGKMLEGRFPERVIMLAIQRMISRNPLGRKQLKNLYVYPTADHKHEAQKPEFYDFAAKNRKNKK